MNKHTHKETLQVYIKCSCPRFLSRDMIEGAFYWSTMTGSHNYDLRMCILKIATISQSILYILNSYQTFNFMDNHSKFFGLKEEPVINVDQ